MRARRIHSALLVLLVLLVPAVATAGDNPIIDTYKTGSSSVVESGMMSALPSISRSFADFTRPVDATATPVDYDGPQLTGIAAFTLAPTGTDFTSLESMETLTGEDDEYMARIGFTTRNLGDASFYTTRLDATLYVAEFTGEPTAPDGGVFGVSLGFTWPGEEVLLSESTFFADDPLTGYAHSVEYGEAAGQPFDYYASVQNQQWTQFTNPLLTIGGPVVRDNTFFFAWVVPGVPEQAAVTLSYADDPTDPATLISQQLVFDVPPRVEYSALEFEFSRLSEADQQALEDQWGLVLAGADDTSTETTTTTTSTTTTTLTPATDDTEGDGPFSNPIWRILGALLFLAIAAFLSAWFTGKPGFVRSILPRSAPSKQPDRSDPEFYGTTLDGSEDEPWAGVETGERLPEDDDGPPKIDWGGPPGSEVVIEDDPEPEPAPDWKAIRTETGAARHGMTQQIIESHEREGGPVHGDEWIAPDEHTMLRAEYGGEGTGSTEWSGTFINIHTGEWVQEPDPLHRELRNRFGIRPDATGTGDGVVIN